MPQSTRRTGAAVSSKAPSKLKPTATVSPDELAAKLASGLTISNTSGKGKQKEKDNGSVEHRRVEAMRAVNTASQGLSGFVQSGWKASKPPPRSSTSTPASAASSAEKWLKELRELCPGDVDIERAAGSVVGKLLALEMYDEAINALSTMHSRLCALYTPESLAPRSKPSTARMTKTRAPSINDQLSLISLPFPSANLDPIDPIILTLILTYLLHTLTAFSYLLASTPSPSADTFSKALDTPSPTLIAWMRSSHLSHLEAKHTDPLLTRAYTALTKSFSPSSPCSPSPRALFLIRAYGLHCLLRTSPSTVPPDTFWDQAIKFCSVYVKLVPSEVEEEAAGMVLETFETFVNAAICREDSDAWMKGRGFVGFCECWMEFAKRKKDIDVLDRIVALIKSSSPAHSPSSSTSGDRDSESDPSVTKKILLTKEKDGKAEKGRDAAALDGARICAAFARATAMLEQCTSKDSNFSTEDLRRCVSEATSTCPFVTKLLIATGTEETEDSERTIGKVDRALERLRRAAAKVIDSAEEVYVSSESNQDIRRCTTQLLMGIVDVLAHRVTVKPGTELLTPALDTLFVLARTTLRPSNPDTYTAAYDFLGRASSLLQTPNLKPNVASDFHNELANYTRCVSGAFHNLAGTLYQAGRYAPAVRFLRDGCTLGGQALEMHEKHADQEDKNADGWKALEAQLYRRWELLGVCCSKMGDRKPAFDAFVGCVRAFPFSKAAFGCHSRAAFSSSTGLKQLGSIIDRATYLSACELLLPPADVSLRLTLPNDAAGAVLERQVQSLEGSMWKEGTRETVKALLEQTLDVYGSEVMPVRRARTHLRCLEFAYFVGPENVRWNVNHVGQEVEELLTREDLREDASLMYLRPQYRIAAHLWLALHAHRRVDTRQTAVIAHHAEEACKILKSLIALAAGAPSPKAKSPKQTVVAPKNGKATLARRAVSGNTKARSTKSALRDPVTPRPRKALEPLSTNVIQLTPPRPSEMKKSLLEFDDFDRLLGLLEMSSQLFGLMGLVLLKVRILDLLRRLCQLQSLTDGYLLASIELAHEYVKLGKTGKASAIYGQALHTVRHGDASDNVRAKFFLRYAESLASVNNVLRSSSAYCEALGIPDLADEEKGMPTSQRVRARVNRLERAAIAARTFAYIQYSREELTASLEGMLQSLRLWTRAVDTLARLNPAPKTSKPPEEESNPFEMTSMKDALPSTEMQPLRTEPPPPKKVFDRRFSMDGLEWRIADGLLSTLFALSQAYFTRGSAREAEYFAQQAQDFAESINTPAMVSRALARKGEVQLHQGRLQEGYETLMQATEVLQDMPGMDTAEIHRLRGDYNQLKAQHKDAQQLYAEATSILEQLDRVFGALDTVPPGGPRKSTGLSPKPPVNPAKETVVPALLSVVLRQHIWLLRDNGGDDYRALLERFLALPSSPQTKAEENALMAKLTLHEVYGRFRADMFFSSIAESTIALPMGMSGEKLVSLSSSTQEIVATLNNAEQLFWANLGIIARRGRVADVRDAAVSLALIRALKTSLGSAGKAAPELAASLLDASTAITLRREMLETIQHKFLDLRTADDLLWPLITPNGSPLPRPSPAARARFTSAPDSDEEDGDTSLDDASLRKYWETIRDKYNAHVLDPTTLSASQADVLPAHWTVINISVTDDKSTMFITRQKAHREPLIFCVPLKGRRESEEDDGHLTFNDALTELRDIIRLSDESTRRAVSIKNTQARAAWWAERSELDKRMRELLENIEFCWLGAFKTILSQPQTTPPEVIADLRTRFDKVFKRSLQSQEKKPKTRIKLDHTLLECFSTLSPKCRDEELEDLIYFILDLYQFHGVPVAIAEVDVDQVAVELRMALEEHAAKMKGKVTPEEDAHMFLVLDKNVQGIPWESIPILRGRSVSRIPSMEFLVDRLQFARWKMGPEGETVVDRALVDPRKGYYLLNPSGDLKGTEGRFSSWLEGMGRVGWQGVVGRVPSEQQLLDALSRNDLVIYFGHGGAEQYIRSHKLRHLPKCAVTMLWGCSSGALREMGDFDRVGTPYNYMLAGCPTLVANLWDVTDRDIDKFSQSVFDKMKLTAEDVGRWQSDQGAGGTSVVSAVAEAREVCKLKYLTGAAPVVYGIPFYL